mgnify:CR=1 FL=1
MKLVVFDCDGTLVDGQHMILESMRHACATCEVIYPGDEPVRRIVGLSLLQAIEGIFPDLDRDRHLAIREAFVTCFQHLRQEGRTQEPLYEGVVEILDHLLVEGYLLGIATGKSQRGLKKTLSNHGLEKYFLTLNTADDGPGKPHPSMLLNAMRETGMDPGNTVMVGDTTYDMEMARAARVRGIGVSWGYHEDRELVSAGASHVIHCMGELPDLLL